MLRFTLVASRTLWPVLNFVPTIKSELASLSVQSFGVPRRRVTSLTPDAYLDDPLPDPFDVELTSVSPGKEQESPRRKNSVPKKETLPTPTDVPAPTPTDVPVPEPWDIPPPDPQDPRPKSVP